ncbi:unnamed protein product [Didymodactylos carnosus]|uniref:Uncharacterized protein n=1 Tax=Didymodactylos carnosus TaxID=1234261 RepID=A0A814Z3L8_9BILA|nr:unnamed protein product [Didymodactylos carnosus]CAF3999059.1 unnamed protein product [Didymodactylos carnosus]
MTHMINRRLTREAIDRLRPHYIRRISLSCGDILGLFAKVTIMMNNEKRFNFDDMMKLANEDNYNLTGLSKEQFDHLMTMLSTLNLRNSPYRSNRTAVACLLAKMRLGISNRVLASVFQLPSKRSVSSAIASTRSELVTISFVPIIWVLGIKRNG